MTVKVPDKCVMNEPVSEEYVKFTRKCLYAPQKKAWKYRRQNAKITGDLNIIVFICNCIFLF